MERARVPGSIAPPGRVTLFWRGPVVPARGLASPPANFRGPSGTKNGRGVGTTFNYTRLARGWGLGFVIAGESA